MGVSRPLYPCGWVQTSAIRSVSWPPGTR